MYYDIDTIIYRTQHYPGLDLPTVTMCGRYGKPKLLNSITRIVRIIPAQLKFRCLILFVIDTSRMNLNETNRIIISIEFYLDLYVSPRILLLRNILLVLR